MILTQNMLLIIVSRIGGKLERSQLGMNTSLALSNFIRQIKCDV